MKSTEVDKDNATNTMSTTIGLPLNRTIKNIHINTLINGIPKPPDG